MKKPSMFSKHYEKEKKKRRKIILIVIIIPIIGLSIFLTTDFKGLLNKGINMKNSMSLNKSKDKEKNTAETQNKSEEVTKQTNADKLKALQAKSDAKVKNETFIVSLSDGQKISIQYTVKAAKKTIKGILNSKDIAYDISPSKKAVVIESKKNQDLLYVDVNKVSKDITKKVYKSSKNKPFSKANKLEISPSYVWSITPKFINEDNIAYVSELPWMNEKAIQYIWKVNIKTNTHMQVQSISGKTITFKNITSKGLGTMVDGNTVYVMALGETLK
ncbi:tRNA (guanine-N1)-methyltransferase [Clostridium psychrophilum]|uniref:tRNA (guanine-N1)-methyltransferase n=1 Tax=Clostridium psychrophilum TaxID=132926 RepID=UPI001C0D446E|nr:tRNA (guanine-N1)-methyltransferase [Clostridium psychrophilum]MBU3180613.1 tRNA (guanine-N1)-methyltransferase [Clostridium psychrophilum]